MNNITLDSPPGSTNPTPPGQNMTASTAEKHESRRRIVAKLKAEGRPAGRPGCGFRHVGRQGNRRRVPDEQQLERMRLVAEWRDDEGLSWNQISDALEARVAKSEGRKALSPADRKGTTKKSCWRMYRRLKELEAAPPPTHRRCRDCGRSLPVARFDGEQQTCRTCAATKPIRRMERRRQRVIEMILIALGRAAEHGRSSDELQPLLDVLMQTCHGPKLGGLDVAMLVEKGAHDEPGSRRVLNLLKSLALIGNVKQAEDSSPQTQIASMTDAELRRNSTANCAANSDRFSMHLRNWRRRSRRCRND